MFPPKWNIVQIIRHAFAEILTNQKIIIYNQEKLMSALDDLKAKLSSVSSNLSKLSSDVDAFIAANTGGASDADLQALGAQVDSLNTAIQAIDVKVAPAAPSA